MKVKMILVSLVMLMALMVGCSNPVDNKFTPIETAAIEYAKDWPHGFLNIPITDITFYNVSVDATMTYYGTVYIVDVQQCIMSTHSGIFYAGCFTLHVTYYYDTEELRCGDPKLDAPCYYHLNDDGFK